MKKMLLSLAMVLPALLFSQSRHELKVDLFGPIFTDEVRLAYEYMPNRKWGIELGLGYYWGGLSVDTIFPAPGPAYIPEYVQFGRHFLNVFLGGKYYVAPKYGADRFFLGLYWWNQWETYRDPAYDEYWERNFNRPVDWDTYRKSSLGVQAGYKWAIMDRFIIEPVFGIDFNFATALKEEPTFEIDAIFFIKAGYRFPKAPGKGDPGSADPINRG
ncbi:MAG: hypothetical protein KDD19_14155 [Phaeodactylibacter sp.]|nr:hypothetical protein [Phaeodactylibacter sp.]MCB9051723.1 hypothetical protein [Lewinellaceae bacterium]